MTLFISHDVLYLPDLVHLVSTVANITVKLVFCLQYKQTNKHFDNVTFLFNRVRVGKLVTFLYHLTTNNNKKLEIVNSNILLGKGFYKQKMPPINDSIIKSLLKKQPSNRVAPLNCVPQT